MHKSTEMPARASERYQKQFTVRLSQKERAALHKLAVKRGTSAGTYFRTWLRDTYRTVFGKEVD